MLLTHEFAPFRGGVATYVHEVAAAAARLSLPVEVWTVDYRGRGLGSEAATDDRLTYPVVRLASNGRLTPGGLLALARGVWRQRRELRNRPVVLLSVGAQMVFFLLDLVGVVPAGRTTCFFHGSEILRFRRNPFWRFLARRFYARAGAFAVNSFHVEHLLRRSGLLPPDASIAVAPCAVPSMFRNENIPHNETPDDGTWRILTVARLHPRKGQLEVARALSLLPLAQRGRIVYQMAGAGESSYRQQVTDACRAGGVRGEFLGAVPDAALPALYRRATLYAQASLTLPQSIEGFGITFLEASFHGCPVAAYRSGGIDEAVRDGETGLLVPEGDEAALARAIHRLLEDPALRKRLGEAGRNFSRGFLWEDSWRILDSSLSSSQED